MTADRRQWIDAKFIITTTVTIVLSAGGAGLASYIGTQTKTAVLERVVNDQGRMVSKEIEGLRAQLTVQTTEFRTKLDALSTLVNDSKLKNGEEIARLKADMDGLQRAIDDRKSGESNLREYYELQASRLDAMRDRLSRIEGELKIPKKE